MYLGYYAGQDFPVRQASSGGPYKMFFAPARDGGCSMGFYRPSQAVARGISPGRQLVSGLGQVDLTSLTSDPSTLALVGIGGMALVWLLMKGGRKVGAARRRHRVRRAAQLRADAARLEL